MKKPSTTAMILLASSLLTSCGSLPKAGPQAALYDFGITPGEAPGTASHLKLTGVEAAAGLEGNEMRYRLAYKNPARIFAYTESRWAAPPDRLLARRFEQRLHPDGSAQCNLDITLEAFDQVFDKPDSSRGVVQLHARLTDGTGRRAISHTMLATAEHLAITADALGGVSALTAAADDAFTRIIAWANGQPCNKSKEN